MSPRRDDTGSWVSGGGDSNGPDRNLDERFADWVDGRLSREEIRELEAEFVADDELRRMAEEYRATVVMLREHLAEDARPPADLVPGVMARLPSAAGTRGRWLPVFASVAAAAAMIALVVFLWDATRGPDPKRADRLADGPSASKTQRVAEEETHARPRLDVRTATPDDSGRDAKKTELELAARDLARALPDQLLRTEDVKKKEKDIKGKEVAPTSPGPVLRRSENKRVFKGPAARVPGKDERAEPDGKKKSRARQKTGADVDDPAKAVATPKLVEQSKKVAGVEDRADRQQQKADPPPRAKKGVSAGPGALAADREVRKNEKASATKQGGSTGKEKSDVAGRSRGKSGARAPAPERSGAEVGADGKSGNYEQERGNDLAALRSSTAELSRLARFYLGEVVSRKTLGGGDRHKREANEERKPAKQGEVEEDAVAVDKSKAAGRLGKRSKVGDEAGQRPSSQASRTRGVAPKPVPGQLDAGGFGSQETLPVLVLGVPAGSSPGARGGGDKKSLDGFLAARLSGFATNVVAAPATPVELLTDPSTGRAGSGGKGRGGGQAPVTPTGPKGVGPEGLGRRAEDLSSESSRVDFRGRAPGLDSGEQYAWRTGDRVYLVSGDRAQIRQFFVAFRAFLTQRWKSVQVGAKARAGVQFSRTPVPLSIQQLARARELFKSPPRLAGGLKAKKAVSELTFYLVLREPAKPPAGEAAKKR